MINEILDAGILRVCRVAMWPYQNEGEYSEFSSGTTKGSSVAFGTDRMRITLSIRSRTRAWVTTDMCVRELGSIRDGSMWKDRAGNGMAYGGFSLTHRGAMRWEMGFQKRS